MKSGKQTIGSKKRNDRIFYAVMVAIPIIQILIFYFGVNVKSIIMAFTEYNVKTGESSVNVFGNFAKFFDELSSNEYMPRYFLNALVGALWQVGFGTVIGVLFSLYIYKNCFGSRAFKVLLFLPSIVSAIVMTTVFSQFADNAIPKFVEQTFGSEMTGLLVDPDTTWGTVLFFCIWSGFGSQILLYVGGMNSISESLSEAAQLDGAGFVKESWYVTIPMIYPTMVTFITVGVATLLTNQFNLYSFFGDGADFEVRTIGYWLYCETKLGETTPEVVYPYLASVGILLSLVTIPLTIGTRKLMTKFGPSAE